MPARLDPAIVHAQIAGLRIRHPQIWEADDEQLLNDMLEGSTDLNEFLGALVSRAMEAEACATGIEELKAVLAMRQSRFEQRVAAIRAIVLCLMEDAGVKKTELPIATLSVRPGIPRVVITDEAALPEACVRIKREPDKSAIKDCLAHGPVSGATLSNAEPILSIRVK